MKKVLRKKTFTILFDHDFAGVIENCAAMYRPGQAGTWITGDMIAAYTELHRLGWAHSAESYVDGELAGGCYGIWLGNVFFGESMFSKVTNASKAAFLTLAPLLFADSVAFIDCQAHTDYLASLGAEEISRRVFLKTLRKTLASRRSDADDRRGKWVIPVMV
jgi:leucyl/phenylalanyl-tRNA--protein transferase